MSIESCLVTAEAMAFRYAGLEFGQECWLGNSLVDVSRNQKTRETECGMSCSGKREELCGGMQRATLWQRSAGV
jgi:hypothetical protein